MSDAVETIVESFILATFALRFSGLYPYSYNARSNRFVLSWSLLLSTVIQLLVFIYVNLSLMLEDWRNYAQPVASSSSLAVVGNLVLRVLGLMSTLVSIVQYMYYKCSVFINLNLDHSSPQVVLLPVLLGSHRLVKDINRQLRFVNDFIDLGFDTHRLYRQMRIVSWASFVVLLIWVSLNCWHAVHFYELLTLSGGTAIRLLPHDVPLLSACSTRLIILHVATDQRIYARHDEYGTLAVPTQMWLGNYCHRQWQKARVSYLKFYLFTLMEELLFPKYLSVLDIRQEVLCPF